MESKPRATQWNCKRAKANRRTEFDILFSRGFFLMDLAEADTIVYSPAQRCKLEPAQDRLQQCRAQISDQIMNLFTHNTSVLNTDCSLSFCFW